MQTKKLFHVLVVGGAILAVAVGTCAAGNRSMGIGASPGHDGGHAGGKQDAGGGVRGW
jgi:hypothetical protein